MNRKILALAALALAVAVGCGTSSTTTVAHHERGNFELSTPQGCGVERWAVKTGTDSAASQVNMTPVDTTVAALTALSVPSGFGQDAGRLPNSAEMQVYRLTATLVEFKMEADSDYHLVLHDNAGNTMIAEIPLPSCVHGSSPFLDGIKAARQAFDTQYPSAANGGFQQAGVTVTITGVGFFDTIHGQTGVAPNGIELHPTLSIVFGDASPSPSASATSP